MSDKKNVQISHTPISIDDVMAVARKERRAVLDESESFWTPVVKGRAALEDLWQAGKVVYGVTTGVGDSCIRPVPVELSNKFATNLLRFHGCGLGNYLDETTGRAVLMVRLASLKSGYSAVRKEVLLTLAAMLDAGVIPQIPEEGSVGASGDLTPLSYVAAAMMGERDVYYNGKVVPAAEALSSAGITPLPLKAKEALAIMNGTSVMTAIACGAYQRASRLVSLGASLTALLTEVLGVNKGHFDLRIFEQKPHPGQLKVARGISDQTGYTADYIRNPEQRIQATYAIRCAPHIIGVLADSLPFMKQFIETEINSVNDNPLIDPEQGDVLHGGNFYGGHIGFAMDAMKIGVANLADLFDRQLALLVNERKNNGLPVNLSGAPEDQETINHGFKAVHIATSALAAEALKGCLPASIFSRSTESNNQDKVSMGTISARDCTRVLQLTEQTLACTLAAAVQALDLRVAKGELVPNDLHPALQTLVAQVRGITAFVEEDRPLDRELRQLTAAISAGAIKVPDLLQDKEG